MAIHVHRCEYCGSFVDCEDDCIEDDQQTQVYCDIGCKTNMRAMCVKAMQDLTKDAKPGFKFENI